MDRRPRRRDGARVQQLAPRVLPGEPGALVIEAIGGDRIVFSTDFPHGDSKFPRAVESFLGLPISEQSKRKTLWENCAAYYGLPA